MTVQTLPVASPYRCGKMGADDAARVRGFLPAQLASYTTAEANALPDLQDYMLIGVSDGNAGEPCLAVYLSGSWRVVALGSAI